MRSHGELIILTLFSLFYVLKKTFLLARSIKDTAIYLNIVLLCSIIFGTFKGDLRLFIICFTINLVIFSELRKERKKNLQSLVIEELRERIYTLADRAGVKLERVYILDTETVNAFATSDNKIILTAPILKYLNKRELDTVIAHELGHLKHKHPQKSQIIILAIILLLFSFLGGFLWFIDWKIIIEIILFSFIVFILICCYSSSLKLARSFEYIADAEAVNLTGDPIAYIQALSKISALNRSKKNPKLRTHPDTYSRIKTIVRSNNISYEQILEMVKNCDRDTSHYTLLAFNTNKVFSTSFKQKITNCSSIVQILIPAIVAWGVELLSLDRYICYLGGLILTFAIFLKTIQWISRWGENELKRKLKIKLKQQGFSVDKYKGIFVGFSPASQPLVYDDFPNWDMGFLCITRDRLCYVGEETRFSLSRKQIKAIDLGENIYSWYNCDRVQARSELRSVRVYISCYEDSDNQINTFYLTTIKTDSLEKYLQKWWKRSEQSRINPYPFSPPILRNLPALKISKVISDSARDNLNFNCKKLLPRLVRLCLLSVTVGLVLNLSVLGIVYIILVACLTTILLENQLWS